jgi:hypothetical protein
MKNTRTQLKRFLVRKSSAEVCDVLPGQKANVQVTQNSEVSIGSDELKNQIVKVEMKLIAKTTLADSGNLFFSIDYTVEGYFQVLQPSDVADLESKPLEAKRFADEFASKVYPLAITSMQRLVHEMGIAGIALPLEYPSILPVD